MYDSGKIITGLVIFFILLLFPVWYQVGKASNIPDPQLTETAKKAGKCVEEKEFMKTQHMKMLDQWRNEVVRDGERYYTSTEGKMYNKSLQVTCLPEISLQECVARDVDFREADFTQADFTDTDFSESLFVNSNLTEVDFTNAKNYNIDASLNVLKKTKFSLPEAMSLLHSLDIVLVD